MKKEHSNQNQKDIPSTIGKPALRALGSANIVRLDQLTSISQEELLKLHGVGPKAIRILSETLAEMGLDFAPVALMDLPFGKFYRKNMHNLNTYMFSSSARFMYKRL